MYVIDFDNTIFDGKEFKEFLFNLRWPENYPQIKHIYENIKKNNHFFDFVKFQEELDLDEKEVYSITEQISNFVFDDFFEFIKNTNEKVLVLSFWDEYFQNFKIKNSWIIPYINNYILTYSENKLEDIKELYQKYKEEITYIDDRIFISEEDFNFPVSIIKIDRIDNDWDINNLSELL